MRVLMKKFLSRKRKAMTRRLMLMDVVRDVDLDPCDDRDDITDPHKPTGGDTLRIDEEAEAYRCGGVHPSARSGRSFQKYLETA